ncbi:MAG: FAD-dependent oxidoreductase [Verrucomicrobia bacterium]|nr:FAD-dependent oxidoreductase [Verrucomicrobiota bacterium]
MSDPQTEQLTAQCCVVGGGPAGMMVGFLLARAGVDVLVLEKHADFFRDFRGDTIHPSTLQVLYELGLLDDFLKQPHQEVTELGARIGSTSVRIADLSQLRVHCRFLAIMPQWDFLNFLAEKAKSLPKFRLLMEHEVIDLVTSGDRVTGVIAKTRQGTVRVEASLVLAADGRHSIVRERASFKVRELGVPIDVLWFRLPKVGREKAPALGVIDDGKMIVLIDRRDYYQAAFIILKGTLDRLKERGLDAFRNDLLGLIPFLKEAVDSLKSWDDVKLLTVQVNRLERWSKPGLLCVGDSAHAMSPVGGVGINLAIQDAVAAANFLADPLVRGTLAIDHLESVQKRREFPTRWTQRLQLFAHRQLLKVLQSNGPIEPALPFRLLDRFRWLRWIPARVIGVGFRPEHVRLDASVAKG